MRQTLLLVFYFQICIYFSQNECGAPQGFTGKLSDKFPNGKLKSEDIYVNGVKHGICVTYYLDGTLRSKEKYVLGKQSEILLKPDNAHDKRDWNELDKPKYEAYKNYQNEIKVDWEERKKWGMEILENKNDSVRIELRYYNNKIVSEKTIINHDLRKYKNFYNEYLNDPYNNYTSETNYFYGNQHGLTKKYYKSGNIEYEKYYSYGANIGTHYTYYDNLKHNIKTVTIYTKTNETKNSVYTPLSIKKHYDSLGILLGYNIHYQVGFKCVSVNNSNVHTWLSCNDHIEGVENLTDDFKDYQIFINSIKGSKPYAEGIFNNDGSRINEIKILENYKLKHLNEKFKEQELPLLQNLYEFVDTIKIPKNKGSFSLFKLIEAPKIIDMNLYNLIMNYGTYYDNNNYTVLPTYKVSGKIANGYMNGKWKFENYETEPYNNLKSINSFTGNYINNKREGIWTFENSFYKYTINYINNKKEGELKFELKNIDMDKWDKENENSVYFWSVGDGGPSYENNPIKLYKNLFSTCTGSFINDKMNGEWKFYYRYPDLLACKVYFNNGELIAKTEEYNLKQQLITKRNIVNNKIISEAFYNPLGNEYNIKNAEKNGSMILLNRKKENGLYMYWNNYTGKLIEMGYYKNKLKQQEWVKKQEDFTEIENFKNDTLHGKYFYESEGYNNEQFYNKKNKTIISGNYENGKKSGLWKYTNWYGYDYKEEIYMDSEIYLITLKKDSKIIIEKGNGIISSFDKGIETKIEEHYNNGKLYKTVHIYTKLNEPELIIYHTEKGDSTSLYKPRQSGTCIKNGTGMKTNYDGMKRISWIDYYSKGKLFKRDNYNEGEFSGTNYFKYANDTSINNTQEVYFEKEITHKNDPNNIDEDYVTLKIKNIPLNTNKILVDDYIYYNNEINPNIEIIKSDNFKLRKQSNSRYFFELDNVTKNEYEIIYKYNSELYTPHFYISNLNYYIGKMVYGISTKYPINH